MLIQYANNPVRFGFIQQAFGAMGLTVPNISTASERHDRLSAERLFLQTDGGLRPRPTVADPERRTIDTCDFVPAYLDAPGEPTGHGFTAAFTADNGDGNCSGDFVYEPADAPWLRSISLSSGYPYGGDQGVVGRAQTAPDRQALLANNGVDDDTSDTLSTPGNLLQSSPLQRVQPGSARLFDVPTFQGLAEPDANDDPRRDSVAFLDQQIAAAEAEPQWAIAISHHRSTGLTDVSELRVFLEVAICNAVKTAAVTFEADGDPSDGILFTGNVGASVAGPAANGDRQALDFFARLSTPLSPVTRFKDLTQVALNAGALVLNKAQPGAAEQLASAFETLFAPRALMPDPVDVLTPEAFRQKLAASPNVILHRAGHVHPLRV